MKFNHQPGNSGQTINQNKIMNSQNQDKATARPWYVAANKYQVLVKTEDGTFHCATDSISLSRDEQQANAALIVKAVNEHAALVAVAEASRLEHLALCKLIEYIETPSNKRSNLDVRDVLYPARECRFNSSQAIANLEAVRSK